MRGVIEQLARRVRLLVSRAVVARADPGPMQQELQVEALAGETLDGIEHFEPYGLTSHPQGGAEAVVASLGGRRSHSIVLVVSDRRYRLRALAQGEVALYDDQGQVVHLRRDQILVRSATQVTVDAPLARFTGDVEVAGNVQADGEITDLAATVGVSLSAMRATYNGHTHPGPGGTTGAPNQAMEP